MSKVYFKRIDNYGDKELINETCYQVIKNILLEENILLKNKVPLKVHFGESGNNTFITPDNFDGVKKLLKELDIETCYIDSNVLYKGSRTKTEDHIKTALEHGFTDLEIVIADGEEENQYEEIEINKKHFEKCKIGTKYKSYNNFIIIAHFKGHGLAGMGASVKQLAMGFASRAGKLHQHSESTPIINERECTSCGCCVGKCPVEAITLTPKAKINPEKCIGCAQCTVACPYGIINNNWQTTNFREKLAEYAYAASLGKKNIYINFAFNITDNCDCVGHQMKTISPNIGLFLSTDPVAIDVATLDIFEKETGIFDFSCSRETLSYAEEIGLGKTNYELIEL